MNSEPFQFGDGVDGALIPFESLVNEQQMLNLALKVLAVEPEDETAGKILMIHVLRNFAREGNVPFTDDQVEDACNAILTDYILTGLVKKGLLDVNFDEEATKYSLTDIGEEIAKRLKDEEPEDWDAR